MFILSNTSFLIIFPFPSLFFIVFVTIKFFLLLLLPSFFLISFVPWMCLYVLPFILIFSFLSPSSPLLLVWVEFVSSFYSFYSCLSLFSPFNFFCRLCVFFSFIFLLVLIVIPLVFFPISSVIFLSCSNVFLFLIFPFYSCSVLIRSSAFLFTPSPSWHFFVFPSLPSSSPSSLYFSLSRLQPCFPLLTASFSFLSLHLLYPHHCCILSFSLSAKPSIALLISIFLSFLP